MEMNNNKRAHNFNDLLGKKFDKLTVISLDKIEKKRSYWKCLCECGKEAIITGKNLTSGKTTSCGCKRLKTRVVDITGQTFGMLTVIGLSDKKKEHFFNNKKDGFVHFWKCLCECGNKALVPKGHLTSSHTISCGCMRKRKMNKNPSFRGCGSISRNFFTKLRHGAERRNHSFELTIEHLWDLFLKQDKKCALSGIELTFQSQNSARDGTASLDRIDSSKGYVEGNVQWVHKEINLMKQGYEQQHFIEMCNKITEHNKPFEPFFI